MATRKVCLPKAKIASMSSAEKSKVVNAKKSAANQQEEENRRTQPWARGASMSFAFLSFPPILFAQMMFIRML